MKRSFFATIIRLTPLLFLLFSSPQLFAAGPTVVQKGSKAQRFVTIDFNDVDINLFIKYISELTKKNFIVDREVKGNVTILSPTRISEDDAYKVFESVLEVHGFTAIPSGSVIKIVPSVQARSKSIATVRSSDTASTEDRVISQIVSLQYANADEVKALLTPLVSRTSVMISNSNSGMLIITDFQSNISRLMEIIKAVDVPSDGEDIAILPLKYASAESVSKAIGQLFVTTARKGVRSQPIKIIPFERINALIVFAPKETIQQVRDIMKTLDTEVPRGEGNIRVVYLQHANAEEMVKVLMNLPDNQASNKSPGVTNTAVSTPAISQNVKIVADTETNALVITGSREEYLVVENVIKKLDIPRRMVYLEALIMEVNVSKDFNIGVQWADGGGSIIGGFSGSASDPYGNLNQMTTDPGSLPAGFSLGVLKTGIEIGGVTFPNLGAVVNAYKSDDEINVIATPQILTTDNKKASIKVGENVPYITSLNTTDSSQDYTNYEYKDVATTLTITPQVNQAEVVRLEIGVEVIKLKDSSAVGTPTTFTRSADTTVIVHNEETVVIGGIIGQDTNSGEYKVPLIGDIPVLGWLFKSRSDTNNKTNLFIFITPHIVENPAELADLYHKKRDNMESVHKQPGGVADQYFHPVTNLDHSVALSDIGFAKLQQNDLVRAREYFDQALKNDPNNGAALINLGAVCEREGKKREAEKLYRQVLAIPPPKDKKGDQAAVNPWKVMAQDNIKRLQRRAKTDN